MASAEAELFPAWDALGIVQHHDAMPGTMSTKGTYTHWGGADKHPGAACGEGARYHDTDCLALEDYFKRLSAPARGGHAPSAFPTEHRVRMGVRGTQRPRTGGVSGLGSATGEAASAAVLGRAAAALTGGGAYALSQVGPPSPQRRRAPSSSLLSYTLTSTRGGPRFCFG